MKLEIIRTHTKVLIAVNNECVAECNYSKESMLFIEFIENTLRQANGVSTKDGQYNIPDVIKSGCGNCQYYNGCTDARKNIAICSNFDDEE